VSKEESIKKKLQRIYELSERGTGGERDTAKRMLDALLARHGVTLDELVSEQVDWRRFKWSTPMERQLLNQVIFHVLQVNEFKSFHLPKNRWMEVKMTEAQAIDVRTLFLHWRKPLERHLQEAFEAFVHVNEIHSNVESDGERKELTPQEIERLKRVMGMMGATTATPLPRPLLTTT
jgi:hypothetical protein